MTIVSGKARFHNVFVRASFFCVQNTTHRRPLMLQYNTTLRLYKGGAAFGNELVGDAAFCGVGAFCVHVAEKGDAACWHSVAVGVFGAGDGVRL